MKRKLWLIAAAAMICAVMFAVGVSAADYTAADGFAGGMGTEADPYQIATAEQLAYLAESVNSGTTYEGQYIKLTADIVLNDTSADNWTSTAKQWTPIGTSSKPFSGTFDGGKHTISGMHINSEYSGLFGFINDADIKNIHVSESYICSSTYAGGIVAYCYGTCTFTNCTNNGDVSASNSAGGIVGRCRDNATATIINCTNSGTISDGDYIGGIIGNCRNNSTVTVINCINSGTVSADFSAGGIAGTCCPYSSLTITDCTSSSTISATSFAGGIIGSCYANTTVTVTNCINSSTVSAYNAGGIIGGNYSSISITITVSKCTNSGNISASNSAGGIVGAYTSSLTITHCANHGMVASDRAGGIVGDSESGSTVKLWNCYNTGTSPYGIDIAYKIYNGEIINCYNTVTLSGSTIVESILGNAIVQNCYYLAIGSHDANGPALTEEQMKSPASFVGFDFTNIWTMGGADYPYPVFRSVATGAKTDALPPTIFAQTNSLSIPIGETAALFVSASVSDGGALSYQWYVSDTESGTGTAIPDAADAGYVPPTTTAGVQYYYVVITNTNTNATGSQTASVTSAVMQLSVGQKKLYTITGSLLTFGDASDVTIELLLGDEVVKTVTVEATTGAGTYSIPDVEAGTYTVRVSKSKHVTREYEVTVGN